MYNKSSKYKLGPKLVVVGGGTGLSVLLRGLKEYTPNITAIVTVADDGGSSGILREDLGMLPPGDIRACLLALANTEPSMERLFNYRFKEGSLKNQNMGNLLIAAMNEIYGNFELAIRETSNVLAVTGKVLPMTLSNVHLCAKLENGQTIKGESSIPITALKNGTQIDYIYMEPEISFPLKESLEAIEKADLIVLGPGSLYTSVIPNLLVNDMVAEMKKSQAKKIYITNVMTQPGETDNYSVWDHVNAILKHSDQDLLDYVIANNGPVSKDILAKYREDGSRPVIYTDYDRFKLKEHRIELIEADLVDIEKGYIKHNTDSLSRMIIDIEKDKS